MTETEQFEQHAAKAFFACAWADAADEAPNSPIGAGTKIFDVMPAEIDPAAVHAARTLRADIERANGRTIAQMMREIEETGDGDRPSTIEHFGHYAAMQAMGHGVGLHDAFGASVGEAVKVPYLEFGSHSLEKDYF